MALESGLPIGVIAILATLGDPFDARVARSMSEGIMADGGEDERKGRLTRIWGGVGTFIIMVDTEFLHAYTIESHIFFLLRGIACLHALSFDFPLRLERIRSMVSRAVRRRRGARRPPGQGVVIQAIASAWLAERAISVLTILLPFILIFRARIAGGPTLAALSGYYYSPMRDIFVDSFCALGALLISYKGSSSAPNRPLTVWAGLSCIGWVLFPVTPARTFSSAAVLIGDFHIISFTQVYIAFSVIAVQFASSERASGAARLTYLVCSGAIFAFLVWRSRLLFCPCRWLTA